MSEKQSHIVKSIWNKLTARTDQQKLMKDIDEVRSSFDVIINFKRAHIQCYKKAIGLLLPVIEQKKNSIKQLTDEIDKLKKQSTDAEVNAEKVSNELKKAGTTEEEIEQNPEYSNWVTVYMDLQSTIEKNNTNVIKRKEELNSISDDIETYKLHISKLHRSLDNIMKEQSEIAEDM
ncbi:MAG: hypothetical protein OXD54_10060 [Candidatus Poribacteria bacterium]|nr:hypothetical protein [Candidatus Poribacteria bacterium]